VNLVTFWNTWKDGATQNLDKFYEFFWHGFAIKEICSATIIASGWLGTEQRSL
jgi:hypothetical protein